MRISYNGITSAFQADEAGSIPAIRLKFADIAQVGEHTLGKGEVGGSNLPISNQKCNLFFYYKITQSYSGLLK